jgi:2-polyprenyl-6-methoxyphenol hydroxylase-like FAD-dependent oxidoreductase
VLHGIGAYEALARRALARQRYELADELSRADAGTVPLAFERYERRCRGFAQRAQAESRHLARAMFVRHPVTAWLRDLAVRRYPATAALRSIIGSIGQPL